MQFTAAQIAELLQGTVEGDPQATVTRLSKIEGGAGSLSFLANPAYTQFVYGTTASVVIIGKDFRNGIGGKQLGVISDPRVSSECGDGTTSQAGTEKQRGGGGW